MSGINFIHAADLHLDASFVGLTRDMARGEASRLHEAAFVALARLFDLCMAKKPDFLILAGDIYNFEDKSVKAQLMVRNGCTRLAELGIPVFIVHGNHDPLSSRLLSLDWPENVTIFGADPSHIPVFQGDELKAVVHGVSHIQQKEGRNLASLLKRTEADCVQIGIVHTTGEASGQTYAPCSTSDFKNSGLDYFALGHVHEHKIICHEPLAQYPGAIQGLHINEQGLHGCLEVSGIFNGHGYDFSTTFHSLAPIIWKQMEIHVDEDMGLDALEQRIGRELDDVINYFIANCGENKVQDMIVRLSLNGRTKLNEELRRPKILAEFLERLREIRQSAPVVWIKDIQVLTRPLGERSAQLKREDLLGEILRLADEYRTTEHGLDALGVTALDELFANTRVRKVLETPQGENMQALLADAEALCFDLLEND